MVSGGVGAGSAPMGPDRASAAAQAPNATTSKPYPAAASHLAPAAPPAISASGQRPMGDRRPRRHGPRPGQRNAQQNEPDDVAGEIGDDYGGDQAIPQIVRDHAGCRGQSGCRAAAYSSGSRASR